MTKPRSTGHLGYEGLATTTPDAKIIEIAIDDIAVPAEMHQVDEDIVFRIVNSINEIGLQAQGVITVKWLPIGSACRATLVVGRHRLEAFRRLGWSMVPATIFDGNSADAELWRINENLARKELTALERAEQIDRAVRLIDEKRKGAQFAQPVVGGQQPVDKGISLAARELGIDRRAVQRGLQIAGLCDEAKTLAVDLGLADNQWTLRGGG